MSEVSDIASTLKDGVDTKGLIDVSRGIEEKFGVSTSKFRLALDLLQTEGYQLYVKPVEQVGTEKKSFIKVLGSPDSKYKDVYDQTVYPFGEEEGYTEYTKDQEAIDRAAYLEHERAIDTIKKVEAREKGE